MKLDLQRVSFIEDARRMLNGATLSVSRLYSITGVDWLIAASINFSSTTALRFADLEGLPSNNTIGPVNARPLQDVRLNHDERNREERPGRFLTARAPIGQHVKRFRQLTTPPGHVKERVYPKLVNQDGDAQRYGGLTAIKKDETIFAAYDNAVDENDEIHRVMMEVEPLLEASGKRNWRSIMLTHDEFPCHCLLQTWWYPKRSNLVLIWDSGELLSMGLPDSSQPITIVIVGVMMAIRWLEAHVRENNRQEAPTREQLQKLDCLKDLDLFETMCKVLNIPMEVKKIWARKRLMPWFRANMTAWLYEYAKKHMSKHGRVYSEYQLDIGAGAFKRAFVTHRNAVTTAVKRISRTSERSGNEKAEMLKEDLERNVTLCLHNSFCRNRESNVDPLPCCKQRVEEQKCWRTASNSVRIVNDVLQDTETESAESVSQEEEMEH